MKLASVVACPICRGRMAYHDAQVIAADLFADSVLGAGRNGAAACACGAWVLRQRGVVSIGDGLRLTLVQDGQSVSIRLTEYGRDYLSQLERVQARGGYWRATDTRAMGKNALERAISAA